MDLEYICFVFVFLVSLLGTARISGDEKNNCTCPEIPVKPLTKAPTETCFQDKGRFRYTCVEGYVRKAGTSNLIKCGQVNGVLEWNGGSLECIPDPKPSPPRQTSSADPRTSQQPKNTTAISTDPSSSRSVIPSVSSTGTNMSSASKGRIAVGASVSGLIILCSVIGLSFLLWKRNRRSNIPQETPEERVPMKEQSDLKT